MKILFITPYDRLYRYKRGFSKSISYAPLTHAVLAALVPPHYNAEIRINDEGVEKPVTAGNYDIVAISCVTSSANRAYNLANFWREKGSYILMGGVHPTLMPEEAAMHCDSVFIGFGEETFLEFLADYAAGKAKKKYLHCQNCDYLSMPLARRDLLSKNYLNIPTVIANRGCQNNCSYCSIHKLWGSKGLLRPVNEVIEELRLLKAKRVIFLDPSPGSNVEYATELFKAMIPLKIKWSGLSTIDIVKNEALFDLMVESGCEGILAGFETINQLNLNDVNKKTNIIADYKFGVDQFHKRGIPILGCFVAGFDRDTRQSLMETIDFINETGIDLPRFSILTPFPGTDLFDRYDKAGRIITRDWDKYDTMNVVFQPLNMEKDELQEVFQDMWRKAYTLKSILKRINNTDKDKILKLSVNLGFKYYGFKLRNNI